MDVNTIRLCISSIYGTLLLYCWTCHLTQAAASRMSLWRRKKNLRRFISCFALPWSVAVSDTKRTNTPSYLSRSVCVSACLSLFLPFSYSSPLSLSYFYFPFFTYSRDSLHRSEVYREFDDSRFGIPGKGFGMPFSRRERIQAVSPNLAQRIRTMTLENLKGNY